MAKATATSQSSHVRSSAILCVYPNVFATADHLGRLSAAVRFDPEHGRQGNVHFVGAQLTRRPRKGFIRNAQNEKGIRQTLYDVTVTHSLAVQRLPHTDFFKRQIKDGALIPADAATAKLANVQFVEPQKALDNAREKLVAELNTIHPEETVDSFVAKWPKFTIGASSQTADKIPEVKPMPPKVDTNATPNDAEVASDGKAQNVGAAPSKEDEAAKGQEEGA